MLFSQARADSQHQLDALEFVEPILLRCRHLVGRRQYQAGLAGGAELVARDSAVSVERALAEDGLAGREQQRIARGPDREMRDVAPFDILIRPAGADGPGQLPVDVGVGEEVQPGPPAAADSELSLDDDESDAA